MAGRPLQPIPPERENELVPLTFWILGKVKNAVIRNCVEKDVGLTEYHLSLYERDGIIPPPDLPKDTAA